MRAHERFLNYIRVDTQSNPESDLVPSTSCQLDFGKTLADEMRALGISDVRADQNGIVWGTIPASAGSENAPVLGLIAHLDTAPDFSGTNVTPRVIESYSGGDIVLNDKRNIRMRVAEFPALTRYIGQDLIVTDGTTLLGADDKAGVAELMTLAEMLLKNPALPHPALRFAFTPDEEIGKGTDHFDPAEFGAAYAYTVDGGPLGEFEYENFNAACAEISIQGVSAHPGTARGVMKNASLIAMEFHDLLPVFENPACTDGREGFFHLDKLEGRLAQARLRYFVRDHDWNSFLRRKELLDAAGEFLNKKYGEGTVTVKTTDSYYNMYEKIQPYPNLINYAQEAMRQCGVDPQVIPIRGGTDGAQLSFRGLPCPNLGTGGHNGHGPYEFIPIQSMDKTVEILVSLVGLFAKG